MSKLQHYIVAAVITVIVVFVVWYFSNVVTYVLIAAVLAIIGKPLTDLLTGLHLGHSRVRIPKSIAALLTLMAIWLVIVGLFWIFVPILFQKFNQISSLDLSQIVASFQEPLASLENMIERVFSVSDNKFSLADAIVGQIRPLLNINLINNFFSSIVGTIGKLLIAVFSISFITFFFLKESTLFHDMVVIMFPKKYEQNISRALDSVTDLLIRYFTGIVSESGIMVVLVLLGLLIFGFSWHDALIIAMLVGVLNVIPYFGPIIGIAIGTFIGVVGSTSELSVLALMLCITGTILFAQVVDNFVLQPLLYSNRVKAHPLEIFLVILIAGSIAGVLGMLLAIPAYNVIRVFAKEFFNNFRVVQKLTEKI